MLLPTRNLPIFLSLCILPLPSVLAWGNIGHRTVAYLAEMYLSPGATTYVSALLGDADISDAAVWADEVRRTHEFHYTKLHPGEAQLIDAQLIRDTCLVGTPDELIERIRELERDGLQELTFATGNDAKWRLAEDFARQVMARL